MLLLPAILAFALSASPAEVPLPLRVRDDARGCIDLARVSAPLRSLPWKQLSAESLAAEIAVHPAGGATVTLRRLGRPWSQRRLTFSSEDCAAGAETVGLLLREWLAPLTRSPSTQEEVVKEEGYDRPLSPASLASSGDRTLVQPAGPSPTPQEKATSVHGVLGVELEGWVPLRSAVARPALAVAVGIMREPFSAQVLLGATLPLRAEQDGGQVTLEQQSLLLALGLTAFAREGWALRAGLDAGVVRLHAWSGGFADATTATALVPALRPKLQIRRRFSIGATVTAGLGVELRSRAESFSIAGLGPLLETPAASLLLNVGVGWEVF